jgi:hypothetical protein
MAAVVVTVGLIAGDRPLVAAESDDVVVSRINELIRQSWTDNEIKPSTRADDGEFARRACLDILGRTPSYEQLLAFLEDDSTDKRRKYVEQLLDDPDYIKNWSTIWGNMLIGRGNRRGGNRANLVRWLRQSFYRNEPYNKFVYDLVSAEGDGARNGAVNFLASHLNDGAIPATAITARLFLGLQVQCTQCHNHPFNDWKQDQFWSMNGFFKGTRRNGGRDMLGLADNPSTETLFYEKRSGLMQATERMFVDGTQVKITDETKPRLQLAKLITDPTKPYLANTQVNRLWGHFFGFGFTRPIDDMGPHNPPSHPELIEYLAAQFKQAGYDNKRLIRWIVASEAYHLTSRFSETNEIDDPTAGNTPLFSRMYLKNFTAEQLYDSLIVATEAHKAGRNYEQADTQRRQWLGQFIRTFATDENDESTTFNGTIPQALVLMNGALTKSALGGGQGSFLRKVYLSPDGDIRKLSQPASKTKRKRPTRKSKRPSRKSKKKKPTAVDLRPRITTLFLVALARKPSEDELNGLNEAFQAGGPENDPVEGLQDIFWAVLNSNEFIINH